MKIEIGPYNDDNVEGFERKVIIHIDDYDTWSMDHTLAPIIAPMLKQLKATKHGAPYVDDEDVPEHLRSINAKPKENEWDTDEFHFDRWDWVLDEMIWAFEQHSSGDDTHQFFDHSEADEARAKAKESESDQDFNDYIRKIKVDHEGLEAHQERKSKAFKLFGKYYQSLWD